MQDNTLWWRQYARAWTQYLEHQRAVEFARTVEDSIMQNLGERYCRDVDRQIVQELLG